MSNFLEEIETEFSRGRGKSSRLSPLDWDLAQAWEKRGVPLSLVVRAMDEAFKQNARKQRPETINSIRYFTPAIEKSFAEWNTSQIGRPESTPVGEIIKAQPFLEEDSMQNSPFAASVVYLNENVEILDNIQTILKPDNFAHAAALPELLKAAIVKTRSEILALMNDVQSKHLSSDKIEARLTELRAELEISLIASVSDDERAKIIADVKTEYGRFHLLKDVEHKVLIRKLYDRFGLPEITLYAF